MLTVLSADGSDASSALAVLLGAHWASSKHPTLLIEADPDTGKLASRLGMQFTPGTASFVTSGQPPSVENLVANSQDVMWSDLHIMAAPPNPAGASAVAAKLGQMGDALRDISCRDLVVVIEGGRVTSERAAVPLIACADAVVLVARADAQAAEFAFLRDVLVDDAEQAGPLGFAVFADSSQVDGDEWRERCSLSVLGSATLGDDGVVDLTVFLGRGKRKSRRQRGQIESIADALYVHAHPGAADSPHPRPRPVPDDAAAVSPPEASPQPAAPAAPLVAPPAVVPSQPSPQAAAPPVAQPVAVPYEPAAPPVAVPVVQPVPPPPVAQPAPVPRPAPAPEAAVPTGSFRSWAARMHDNAHDGAAAAPTGSES